MTAAQQVQQARRRHQGIGTRVWLIISESSDPRLDEEPKSHIMRRTGLPARDLRVLDPVLSYPSTILGRERAIVVNLEHIKAVVTATEVLMVNSSNPLVVEFVEDLRGRISGVGFKQVKDTMLVDMQGATGEEVALIEPLSSGPKSLPFEFKALEVCLESACRCLESETSTLEKEAYPALDELSSHISTLNLERVRQIKSRLVAISGRVQKVRDELEHLLDDDNDMAEMYLTEKLQQSMEQTSFRDETDKDYTDVNLETDEDDESRYGRNSDAFTNAKPNVEELEMLLEAYFAQVDGISQKLSTMSEYVGDTEDYINIMLDDKQNQLLQMGVMLSTATMIINAGIVVVGMFGMNIHIELFDGQPKQFWETAFGTTGGCLVLYLLAVGWGKKRFLFSM